MEVKNTPIGSYKIENVVLLNSIFSRELTIDSTIPIEIEASHNSEAQDTDPNDGKFGVSVTFEVKGLQGEFVAFSATITMIGLFEKYGEPALPEDAFKKVNAPAIIYPFIREHIHNLCQKATIGNVLMPTVNFKI